MLHKSLDLVEELIFVLVEESIFVQIPIYIESLLFKKKKGMKYTFSYEKKWNNHKYEKVI